MLVKTMMTKTRITSPKNKPFRQAMMMMTTIVKKKRKKKQAIVRRQVMTTRDAPMQM